MNPGIPIVMAAIAYLAAAALYGSAVIENVSDSRPMRLTIGRICALVGVFVDTSAIGFHCIATRHTPVSSPADLLSATGWSVAIAYLIIEALMNDRRPAALGALSFALSFLAIFAGSSLNAGFPRQSPEKLDLDNAVISLHIVAVLFAFAFLFLAVCCAALYVTEHRLLKQKKVAGGLFGRLPPLTTLDRLSFGLVSLAFPLLTIGFLAGAIRAFSTHLPLADLHTAMSVATWAVLGAYLAVHASALDRGVRANYLLLLSMVCAVLTYMFQNQMHHFA